MKVGDDLVSIDEFTGPIEDENYIEGTVELLVGHKPILSREQVDLVDQLWAYLVDGLEEIISGREFSTCYPDMPVEIVLRPKGNQVLMKVDNKSTVSEAWVNVDDLRRAIVDAAALFFERLRPFVLRRQTMCEQYLARLAALR